jgi:hypothetical protein
MGEIQNGVTQQNQKFLMFTFEQARQRLISGLNHNAFPHPLPELCLSRPKLFTIAAHYQGGLLLSLFFLLDFFIVDSLLTLFVFIEYTSALACSSLH